MVTSRGLVTFAVSLGISVATVGTALAQVPPPAGAPAPVPPRPTVAPLVGLTEQMKVTTPTGFIDDVVATEDGRIAYVIADTASKAELHVLSHATKQEQVVDLAPVTLYPVGLHLVGQRAFVIGRTEDGSQIGALVELTAKGKKPAGTVVYKLPPATSITVVKRDGKQRLAVYRTSTTGELTRHDVEVLAIETGKRVAAAKPFEVDSKGKNARLDFKVNHWSDGMTRAYGIKAGEWDKKEDQRAPDVEAAYDLISGKFSDKKKIVDLFEQRRRFQALSESGKRLDFIRLDISGLQLWRGGTSRAIEIDQPLTSYDPKSMQGIVAADGSGWIVLKMDPVNAEAVARKKADPEYLDIFRVTADGKATRKARVLATGVRHRFGVIGDTFWLIERNNGFERGGKSLAIYQLQ
jgi:hypothetical protein